MSWGSFLVVVIGVTALAMILLGLAVFAVGEWRDHNVECPRCGQRYWTHR